MQLVPDFGFVDRKFGHWVSRMMGDPSTKMVFVDGSPNPYENCETVAQFFKLDLRKILTNKQAYLST